MSIDLDKICTDNDESNRRIRSSFKSYQLIELENEFKKNIYLSRIKRIQIAQNLKLSEKQGK